MGDDRPSPARNSQNSVDPRTSEVPVLVKDPPTYLCRKATRSNLSPPNFDEIERQFDEACAWLKSAPTILPEHDDGPFIPLNFDDTHFPSDITEPIILNSAQWVKGLFREYEERRLRLEDLKKQTEQSAFEEASRAVSPILLCIALALRITKVTGEIRLERKRP